MASNNSSQTIADLLRRAIAELEGNTTTSTVTQPTQTNPTTSTAQRQPAATPSTSQGTTVRAGIRQLFAPYPQRGRSVAQTRRSSNFQVINLPGTTNWTHKFCCLALSQQEAVPDRGYKKLLHDAGLGDKKITMCKNNDPLFFREFMEKTFPKLKECGGYEVLRTANRTLLELVAIPNTGYTSAYLADESSLGSAIAYIRPLQKDLSIDPDTPLKPSEDCLKEQCKLCERDIPVVNLKTHIASCQPDHDTDDEELPSLEIGNPDDELPTITGKRKSKSKTRPICDYVCQKKTDNEKEEISGSGVCPVCGMFMPVSLLEDHANICCDKIAPKDDISFAASLKESLSLKRKTILDTKKKWNISVRRSRLISTTMEMMQDADPEDWTSELVVRFVGEDGVDAGGLKRELFSLFFEQTPLLDGNTFSNIASSLQEKEYKLFGQLVATAIVFGHPGPRCLHKSLVHYILSSTEEVPSGDIPIKDIESAAVSTAVKAIEDASTEAEFLQAGIAFGDLLETAGFQKKLSTTTRDSAIYTLKEHHIFYRCLGHLRQFMEGLKLHGVLDALRSFPDEGKQLLQAEASILTAEEIKNFYLYAVSEGENKEREESIVYNFHRFLGQVEKGRISSTVVTLPDEEDTETTSDVETSVKVTLAHVMMALLGSPGLPRDLDSGLIEFNHESLALSYVNTCAPSITFQNTTKLENYKDFENAMMDIIYGAVGFGKE